MTNPRTNSDLKDSRDDDLQKLWEGLISNPGDHTYEEQIDAENTRRKQAKHSKRAEEKTFDRLKTVEERNREREDARAAELMSALTPMINAIWAVGERNISAEESKRALDEALADLTASYQSDVARKATWDFATNDKMSKLSHDGKVNYYAHGENIPISTKIESCKYEILNQEKLKMRKAEWDRFKAEVERHLELLKSAPYRSTSVLPAQESDPLLRKGIVVPRAGRSGISSAIGIFANRIASPEEEKQQIAKRQASLDKVMKEDGILLRNQAWIEIESRVSPAESKQALVEALADLTASYNKDAANKETWDFATNDKMWRLIENGRIHYNVHKDICKIPTDEINRCKRRVQTKENLNMRKAEWDQFTTEVERHHALLKAAPYRTSTVLPIEDCKPFFFKDFGDSGCYVSSLQFVKTSSASKSANQTEVEDTPESPRP